MKIILYITALSLALIGCSKVHDYSGTYFAATGSDCKIDTSSSLLGVEMLILTKVDHSGKKAYSAKVSNMKTTSLEPIIPSELGMMHFNFSEERGQSSSKSSLTVIQHPEIEGNLVVTNWTTNITLLNEKITSGQIKMGRELGNQSETDFCITKLNHPKKT